MENPPNLRWSPCNHQSANRRQNYPHKYAIALRTQDQYLRSLRTLCTVSTSQNTTTWCATGLLNNAPANLPPSGNGLPMEKSIIPAHLKENPYPVSMPINTACARWVDDNSSPIFSANAAISINALLKQHTNTPNELLRRTPIKWQIHLTLTKIMVHWKNIRTNMTIKPWPTPKHHPRPHWPRADCLVAQRPSDFLQDHPDLVDALLLPEKNRTNQCRGFSVLPDWTPESWQNRSHRNGTGNCWNRTS